MAISLITGAAGAVAGLLLLSTVASAQGRGLDAAVLDEIEPARRETGGSAMCCR